MIEIGIRLERGSVVQNNQLIPFGPAVEIGIRLEFDLTAHDALTLDSPSQTCGVNFWG